MVTVRCFRKSGSSSLLSRKTRNRRIFVLLRSFRYRERVS